MSEKIYKEERFEFSLFINENLVCKRNFKINNYIEHSMETIEFKNAVDDIVSAIDNDLKSKSRVYTWLYGDVSTTNQEPLEEFVSPLIDPWTCTFKFVVTDNKVPVIEKIWDGRYYPKAIRERVDIANKTVKITNRDGKVFTYDKVSFFDENKDRLSPELYCLREMIYDKTDLLVYITKHICDICSPRENGCKKISDYTLFETFGNDSTTKKASKGIKLKSNKYAFTMKAINSKVEKEWAKATSEKTKKYFQELY